MNCPPPKGIREQSPVGDWRVTSDDQQNRKKEVKMKERMKQKEEKILIILLPRNGKHGYPAKYAQHAVLLRVG